MRRQIGAGGSHSVQQQSRALEAGGPAIRYVERDADADGGMRQIELHQDHVVLRRRRAGIPMKFTLRYAAFEGIAVRLTDPEGDGEGVAIVLVHADPGLSVTLHAAPDADDVVAEWRRWTAHTGLPMLVTGADGAMQPAYRTLGRLVLGKPLARRRRGALKYRRPLVFKRRAVHTRAPQPAIHRGEREFSARD